MFSRERAETILVARLCPLSEELTEQCMMSTPMLFAWDSSLEMSNSKMFALNSTFLSEGTLTKGSTWQMNPIHDYCSGPNTSHGFPAAVR